MTAKDRFIRVAKDGTIYECEENDGWSYMSGGADRQETIVSLSSLDGNFLSQAVRGLEAHGYQVDVNKRTFTKK